MNENRPTTFSTGIISDASTASDHILCKSDLDIKVASIKDLPAAKSAELRRLWIHGVHADTNAVGWLPTSVFDARASTDEVTAVYRDGDLVGWCLRGESKARKVLKIYQIWVRPDARILEHGRALVADLQQHARSNHCWYLEAWVAADLAANIFWKAIGFQRTVWRWGRGRSLRKIFRWITFADGRAAASGGLSAQQRGESATGGEFLALESYDHNHRRHSQHIRTF